MHEEQNNVAVEAIQSGQQAQATNSLSAEEKERLRNEYLTLARRLCPSLNDSNSETRLLWVLHRKIQQFIKALTNFDRPWEKGMPEIEKGCLKTLIDPNLPQKERQKLLDSWVKWSEFLLSASFCRGYISQILQDYHFKLRQIEVLLKDEPKDIPEEYVNS